MKKLFLYPIAALFTVASFVSCHKGESPIQTKDYSAPVVITMDASNITGTKASLNGKVDFTGGKPVIEMGFRLGTDKSGLKDYTIESDSFSLCLNDLAFETTYYYQAFASSEMGKGFGEMKEFTTCPAISFKKVEINSISASEAIVTGGIENDGGIEIEEQGFYYCKIGASENTFIDAESEVALKELEASTTYTVWYYAKSIDGVFNGPETVFTTLSGLVELGTLTNENTGNTFASFSCKLLSGGGATIMSRGFCYSLSPEPTIQSSVVLAQGSTDTMTGTINDLNPCTKYYIRAFATTNSGTTYSNEVSITTNYNLPQLSPVTICKVGPVSATVSSSVISAGDGYILEKGFCLSTSHSPGLNDSITYVNSSWTVEVSGLAPNTIYYVRSFATSQYGTSFSEEASFTTEDFNASITSLEAISLSLTGATLSGILELENSEWLSESSIWFLYSDSVQSLDDLKLSGIRVDANMNGGIGSVSLTGLKEYTTYYYIACARVLNKTVYSTVKFFKTVAVDLGLSVMWSACNVGASYPHEWGEYYAWAETKTKNEYRWSNYKYGTYNTLNKYNTISSYGTVDGITELQEVDNVAKEKWGGAWRLPTNAEWSELKSNCSLIWTTLNGVVGCLVTSKKNGNSIFLPAAEEKDASYHSNAYGKYWLSSISKTNPDSAYVIEVEKDPYNNHLDLNTEQRCYGLTIRPVIDK